MRSKMPIHKAFLLQAREDYQASAIMLSHFQNGGEKAQKENHPLFLSTPFHGAPFFMLLQMSVEKLSKAAYCKARGISGKLPPKDLLSYSLRRCWPEIQIFRRSVTDM